MAPSIGKSIPAADVHVNWDATGNSIMGTLIKPYALNVINFDFQDLSTAEKLHLAFTADGKDVVFQNADVNITETIGNMTVEAENFLSVIDGDDHYGFVKGNTSFTFGGDCVSVDLEEFQFYFSGETQLLTKGFTTPDTFEWDASNAPTYETTPVEPIEFNFAESDIVVDSSAILNSFGGAAESYVSSSDVEISVTFSQNVSLLVHQELECMKIQMYMHA